MPFLCSLCNIHFGYSLCLLLVCCFSPKAIIPISGQAIFGKSLINFVQYPAKPRKFRRSSALEGPGKLLTLLILSGSGSGSAPSLETMCPTYFTFSIKMNISWGKSSQANTAAYAEKPVLIYAFFWKQRKIVVLSYLENKANFDMYITKTLFLQRLIHSRGIGQSETHLIEFIED